VHCLGAQGGGRLGSCKTLLRAAASLPRTLYPPIFAVSDPGTLVREHEAAALFRCMQENCFRTGGRLELPYWHGSPLSIWISFHFGSPSVRSRRCSPQFEPRVPCVSVGWMYHVAVTRRLHDIGRSGWRQILSPRFAVMGLEFVPSDPHPNAYGPRPRKAAAREQLLKGTSDISVTMVAQC
jgi:Protein of unknown function (DUF805)